MKDKMNDSENLNMNFMNAMFCLMNGNMVTRRAWNKHISHFLSLNDKKEICAGIGGLHMRRVKQETIWAYKPEIEDFYAQDWELFNLV